jgi:hypothetical protein
MDSPRADKGVGTNSIDYVCAIAVQAPGTRARQLAESYTGDESWSYCEYVRELIWTTHDYNTPEVANRIIPCRNSMSTVLWHPHGFYAMTMLHGGASFDAPWFIDQSLIPLVVKSFPMWKRRTKAIVSSYGQCTGPSFHAHHSFGLLLIRKKRQNGARDSWWHRSS